jgi:hypothetical protein
MFVCVCHCLGVRRRGGAGKNYNRSHVAVACVHSVLALVGSFFFRMPVAIGCLRVGRGWVDTAALL